MSDKVVESWARGVEWELTRMVYGSNIYKGRGINRESDKSKQYTLVVVDMIDSPEGSSTNHGLKGDADKVEGYTIRQLEDALKSRKDWNGWRDAIIRNYENETEEHLYDLFTNHVY